MPSTMTSPMSTCSSSSVPVPDQPGLEPGSIPNDQPFTVVKPKRRRQKPSHHRPQPLSQPLAGSHTLLFRPKGKASLESADFPVLLTILQALGALLPARWIRGGGLAVDFATATMMESAASVTALAGVAVRAAKPVLFACRTGVVSGVPPGLSPSAFISEAAAGNPDVKFHRAQRLGLPATSRTLKVVFEGSCLPSSILFRFRSHPVRPFERRAPTASHTTTVPGPRKLPFSAAPAPPAPPVETTARKLAFSAAPSQPATKPPRAEPAKRKLSFSAVLTSSPAKRLAPVLVESAAQTQTEVIETAIQTDVIEPPAPVRQVYRPRGLRASSVMVTDADTQVRPACFQSTRWTMTNVRAPPTAISVELLVGAAYCLGSSNQGSSWHADISQLRNLILQHTGHPADLDLLADAADTTVPVDAGEPLKTPSL